MKKEKVVAYCRVSTAGQKEEQTVDIQKKAIADYCKKNGLKLVKVFADEGYSGELEERPDLTQMRNYLLDGDIKTILLYKYDRLARDIRLQENFIFDFGKLGCSFKSINENLEGLDDGTRQMIRGIFGIVAQYEKWAITHYRMTPGRKRKAQAGRYAGGGMPLGYEVKDKDLTQSAEAKLVHRIFKLKREKRMGLREIARLLNSEGITTRRGKSWDHTSVRYILNNPIYSGIYRYSNIQSKRLDLAILPRSMRKQAN